MAYSHCQCYLEAGWGADGGTPVEKTLIEAQDHLGSAYDAIAAHDLVGAMQHVLDAERALHACYFKLRLAENSEGSRACETAPLAQRAPGEDSIEPTHFNA
jgi:hypothetical protein